MTDETATMLEKKQPWRFSLRQLFYFLIFCTVFTPIGAAAVQGKPWGLSFVFGICAFIFLILVNMAFYFALKTVSVLIGR